jgi:hypothetical protein
VWADIAERTVLEAGAIPQIVNEEKADLLILGVPGGDEVEQHGIAAPPSVLRAASCPVLIIPATVRKLSRQARAPSDGRGAVAGSALRRTSSGPHQARSLARVDI